MTVRLQQDVEKYKVHSLLSVVVKNKIVKVLRTCNAAKLGDSCHNARQMQSCPK